MDWIFVGGELNCIFCVDDCKLSFSFGDFCSSMSHNPSPDVLLFPSRIILLFLKTCILLLSSRMLHPSSHSCPREIKFVWISLNNDAFLALVLNVLDNGRNPCKKRYDRTDNMEKGR